MANSIQIKRKSTTGAPLASSLIVGEMCWVDPDNAMYIKKIDNSVTQINSGGGGSKDYASFYLNTGGLTGQSNTERTIVINSTHVNSNASIFVLAANEVTINKAGDFKIDADVYFNNSSTSRTEYTVFLELDGVEVEGSRCGIYQRGYDSGSTGSINMIIAVTSGQVLTIRINRTDGGSTAGYQDNDGTRLTIEEK